jgi:hypothetical protein
LQVLAQRQHEEDEELFLLSREEKDCQLHDEDEQQRLQDEFQMELLEDEQMEEHHQRQHPGRHGALEVDITGWDDDDDDNADVVVAPNVSLQPHLSAIDFDGMVESRTLSSPRTSQALGLQGILSQANGANAVGTRRA